MDTGSAMSALPYARNELGSLPRRVAPKGKRMKKAAYGQTSTSTSIPSRYRTVVFSNTESRGFNSQAARFPAVEINSNPGPGSYGVVHNSLETSSTSYSTRGTGGCATLKKRFSNVKLQPVGPGTYSPMPVENRRDFSQAGGTSTFQNPVATTVYDPKKQTPAPNAYTPRGQYNGGKNRLITGESVFKSKTTRPGTLVPELTKHPCPTQYDVTDKILQKSSHAYGSVFKSKSQRSQKKTEKLPGPADYHVNTNSIGNSDITTLRKGFYNYKGKNALLISAPALPRCPSPVTPGPGHYNTHVEPFDDRERHTGADATFKSVTGRWMSESKASKLQEEPGPGSYNPTHNDKRSYYFNIYRKWV